MIPKGKQKIYKGVKGSDMVYMWAITEGRK